MKCKKGRVYMSEKGYVIPNPILNSKEQDSLLVLTERYNKLTKPGLIVKTVNKVGEIIPEPVKKFGGSVKDTITGAELYAKCMGVVANGFNIIEKHAANMTLNDKAVIRKINNVSKNAEINSLEEVCLVRGYDISKAVGVYKKQDLFAALIEGGATGYFGFAGLPFNLVLSLFLYYRAVQSIAMFYGYDVKNDSAELVIASEVFMNALSPNSSGTDEMSSIIGKVMLITELTAVKQTAKKTWADMAARGGIGLLLTQMRALANKSAKKALEKVGQKGLESSLFKEIFEQIGKKLSKKALGKAIPVAGALIGAFFDTAQMNTILEYADVFYNKRYILEKEARIKALIGMNEKVVEVMNMEIY